MPITVDCPSCNRKLRVPDELLGKKVKCPTCSTTFTAGEGAEAPAEPPPPPPEEEEVEPRPPARRPAAPPPDEYDEDEDQGYERPRRRGRRRGGYSTPHRGAVILVLGIISLALNLMGLGIIGLILGPIAWTMGTHDLQEIRAGRMDPEGEGTTNAGKICGIIGTILGILNLLCCGIYLVIVIAAVASNPH